MTGRESYRKVVHMFESRFQRSPEIVVRAPGRINFIGEHTDYNDGFVMPVAVDRAAWVAAAPQTREPWTTVRALDMGGEESIFAMDRVPASAGGWADYPKSLVWAFLERKLRPVPIDAVLTSDVPVGAGMSSSAAVELAFAYTWGQLSGFELSPEELALLSQHAENEYVGVNCGIMDQMISATGRAGYAMLLDTRSMERGYFSLPKGIALVVADSGVRRSLSNSEYNVRRVECEQAVSVLKQHIPEIKSLRDVSLSALRKYGKHLSDVVFRRARHVVTENLRVIAVAKALQTNDLEQVGELLVDGHRSLRDDYEVSIPELDTLVEAAVEVEGCYGARLTGAGFGGCIIAIADEDAVPELKSHLGDAYDENFDRRPTVYVTHSADGVAKMEEGDL